MLSPRYRHLHVPTKLASAPSTHQTFTQRRSGRENPALFRLGETFPSPGPAPCLLLAFAKGELRPPALVFLIYASGRPLVPGIRTVTMP